MTKKTIDSAEEVKTTCGVRENNLLISPIIAWIRTFWTYFF